MNQVGSIKTTFIIIASKNFLMFPEGRERVYWELRFFLVTLFRFGVFLSVAYLTVANLARLGILVRCLVSVRSQYLVRILSQCWITDGHTVHPPIEVLLPSTGIKPIPFRNSAFKVAELLVHATTPGIKFGHPRITTTSRMLKTCYLPKKPSQFN